jgi:AcrR family transcriptional regulator
VDGELPTWDWDGLTFRALAERAEVSERTVYRHFPTERKLHDAVMERREDEAASPTRTSTSPTSRT